MARRRYRKNAGLIEVALQSDWKVSAVLAVTVVVVGIGLVPMLFDSASPLAPLSTVIAPAAWLLAGILWFIALIRFVTTGRTSDQRAYKQAARIRAQLDNRSASGAQDRREPFESAAALNVCALEEDAPPRPECWSLAVLDRIEWKRFEDLCCAFYREKGIRVETTRLGADGGIDIRLFQDPDNPERPTAIVQCKALSKQVGVKPVRELRGVMAHEKVDKAFFMAPNGFTDEARSFAVENRITLLDGKLFLAMLQRLSNDAGKRLLDFATEGDWTTPTCPNCGTKMAARDSRRGPFWGCPAYPKCRGTLPMRASAS